VTWGRPINDRGFREVAAPLPHGKFFDHPDGRGLVQIFYNKKFQNWGINPDMVLEFWKWPKGIVRVQLVDPNHAYGAKAEPNWEIAIPVSTLMRKMARSGDFVNTQGGGFFRLFDNVVNPEDKD
jgi:hypothetical protein